MAKRRVEKGFIDKIFQDFSFLIYLEVGNGELVGVRIALRGLELPDMRSDEAQPLVNYLAGIFKGPPFPVLAIERYDLDPLLRFPADIHFLVGEANVETVLKKGRHLNQELLDRGFAKPYNEKIRRITGNFKAQVCEEIAECQQILQAALGQQPHDTHKRKFLTTDDESLIVYGMKELKELSMRVAGYAPLDWKGN